MKKSIVWQVTILIVLFSVTAFGQNVHQEEAKRHFDRGLKGVDGNAKDDEGATPLHLAVQEGRKDLAELLIDKGATPRIKRVIQPCAMPRSTSTSRWSRCYGSVGRCDDAEEGIIQPDEGVHKRRST
jgi:hypothetical protein